MNFERVQNKRIAYNLKINKTAFLSIDHDMAPKKV